MLATMILALSWYFLVDVNGTRNGIGDGPSARGPFPTKEACRIAGEHMFPGEERFWTAEKAVKVKAEREERQRKREAEFAELRKKAKPKTWVTLSDGSQYYIDAPGESSWLLSMVGSSEMGYSRICPCFWPITGCMSE